MTSAIKTYNKNYNFKDLLDFFRNHFSAPLAKINNYGTDALNFGFRSYTVFYRENEIEISQDDFNNEDLKLNKIFTIDTANFKTWGDLKKYLTNKKI